VIAHLVLFRPRPDLSDSDRRALIDAWAAALREIPSIRRARIGRRIRIGRAYEALTRTDFAYAAILEFDDAAGLREYLDHAAHEAVATRLFAAIEETAIYDLAMEASADALGEQ
jgi:hypothetical protein